jgi:hypothetical protein
MMPSEAESTSPSGGRPRYRWPWFLLAAVLIGLILAFVWISREIERTRRLRDPNPLGLKTDLNGPGGDLAECVAAVMRS